MSFTVVRGRKVELILPEHSDNQISGQQLLDYHAHRSQDRSDEWMRAKPIMVPRPWIFCADNRIHHHFFRLLTSYDASSYDFTIRADVALGRKQSHGQPAAVFLLSGKFRVARHH